MSAPFKTASRLHPSIAASLRSLAAGRSESLGTQGNVKRVQGWFNPLTNRENTIIVTTPQISSFAFVKPDPAEWDHIQNRARPLNRRAAAAEVSGAGKISHSATFANLVSCDTASSLTGAGAKTMFSFSTGEGDTSQAEAILVEWQGLNIFCPANPDDQVELRALYDVPTADLEGQSGRKEEVHNGEWFTPRDVDSSRDFEMFDSRVTSLEQVLSKFSRGEQGSKDQNAL
ncbi:uncharacterized protein I303_106194 [Kwoniella dejecticola CBS 10117]|uniref:Uncharacterized protein n=1 Tax=Kwoniella dejecticola CBS 10117 TaxID=1296121 RepID=A0A1A6A1I8_9TREE|nr:uncharacterized protein I303_06212 [Kwoniella dejecticola CBS 10117]OBR83926.1 hypothetical protein I303_06212 [Kwoniella dejecticola CBS 10117]